MNAVRARRSLSLALGLTLVLGACTAAGAPTSPPSTQPPAGVPTVTPAGTAPASPPPTAAPVTAPPQSSAPSSPAATPTDGQPAGFAWHQLTPLAGPSAREDHTWTVDGEGGSAYLYGGRSDGTASDELWRFDLVTDSWTRIEATGPGPSARFGHVAVWVEGVGLVIWSGQAGSSFFSDLWAFDPVAEAWRELPAAGTVPPARYGSCGALGPDGRLWISHGFTEDSGRFADTVAYDFSASAWADMTPSGDLPVVRCLHDCLWTPDGRLVLYAGQTTGVPAIGDLWTYDPETAAWTEQPEPAPDARQLYALASAGGTAYVFGGRSLQGDLLDDLWTLDLASLAWTRVEPLEPRPPGAAGATLISDESAGRLLLFGGTGADGELTDLWQLDLVPAGG